MTVSPIVKSISFPKYVSAGLDSLGEKGFNMSEICSLGCELIFQQMFDEKNPKSITEIKRMVDKNPSPFYQDYLNEKSEQELKIIRVPRKIKKPNNEI